MSRRLSVPPSLIAIALLLIYAYLQLSSLAVTSITMDEPSHLAAGYAFLTRGDTRIRLNGPILNNLIGAVPLLLEPDLKLTPADDPAWNDHPDAAVGDLFMFANTAPASRLIFLARFPFILISWLLGALIYRWARERNGASAGLFALALYVFCPNLLAHSRLAMTDFVPSALACLTLYTFDRWLSQPDRRRRQVAVGIALGLALASKFPLLMVAAALPILALVRVSRQTWLRRGGQLVLIFGMAGMVIWSVYGFQIKPAVPGGLPVPAPGLWQDIESARQFLADPPWVNYLFGATSSFGWWYYFPVALLVKTPLSLLILYALALGRTIVRRSFHRDLIFLLPSGLLFVSLLFSSNNVGYRYLLPLLPLAFVYVSQLRPRIDKAPTAVVRLSRLALAGLLLWQVVGTLRIYPYYLTFFNEIAGGPDGGRYILSDSNIDWGQDLIGLKDFAAQHTIDRIKLSYFGVDHPTDYGLNTEALPPVRDAMRDQGAWWLHTYYPLDPAPGKYAISVANLMGGIWIDPAEYAFFRDRRPDTTIGNSIYLYTIAPRGEAANLSLAGLQIDQIDAGTYRQFNTNDVRPRWFDATSSLIAAPGESWIAIADDQALTPEFQGFFANVQPIVNMKLTDEDRAYTLYQFDLGQRLIDAAQQTQSLTGPVTFGESATLIGYQVNRVGTELALITYWRAGEQVVTPLQMFVHVAGPDGVIVAQADRLDASPFGWRAGDVIAQIHRLAMPAAARRASVSIGLYNSESGVRLPVGPADQLIIDLK